MSPRIRPNYADTSKGDWDIIGTCRTQKRGYIWKERNAHAPLTTSYGCLTHLCLFSSGHRLAFSLHLLVAGEHSRLAPRPAHDTLGLE